MFSPKKQNTHLVKNQTGMQDEQIIHVKLASRVGS